MEYETHIEDGTLNLSQLNSIIDNVKVNLYIKKIPDITKKQNCRRVHNYQ